MYRILTALAKRNQRTRYCQGMNFMCVFFLDLGLEEEEIFWIMAYLFDNVIPRDYYTNMIPLISDMKLLKFMIKQKFPHVFQFIRLHFIDLNLIFFPWFLVAFTQLRNMELKILIMSRLISEGTLVFFKLVLILMDMISPKLPLINQQCDFKQMITYLLEDQINNAHFKEQLNALFISNSILDQIRKTMVRKELLKLGRFDSKSPCNPKAPFCVKADEKTSEDKFDCFSAKNMMANLKVDHFKPF